MLNRNLQIKLDQPVSAPPSPRDTNNGDSAPTNSTPEQLTSHIQWLRNEVSRLKHQLTLSLQERKHILNDYHNYSVCHVVMLVFIGHYQIPSVVALVICVYVSVCPLHRIFS